MNYAAFNKPASVYYWVRSGRVPPGVVYVMQLDADMLLIKDSLEHLPNHDPDGAGFW